MQKMVIYQSQARLDLFAAPCRIDCRHRQKRIVDYMKDESDNDSES